MKTKKLKTFKGWAIFDADGEVVHGTIRRTKLDAIYEIEFSPHGDWGEIKQKGYRVERIVISPAGFSC